jgi:hypothetical protein
VAAALDKLPGDRYRHLFEFSRLEWNLTESGDILTAYAEFLNGTPRGNWIFNMLLDKILKGTPAQWGVAGEEVNLDEGLKMFYVALLGAQTIAELRASAAPFGDITQSIAKVRQHVKAEAARGRPFIFEYQRPQARPDAGASEQPTPPAGRPEARLLDADASGQPTLRTRRPGPDARDPDTTLGLEGLRFEARVLDIQDKAPAEAKIARLPVATQTTSTETTVALPKIISRESQLRVAQVTGGILPSNVDVENRQALLTELVPPEFKGLSGADTTRYERLRDSKKLTTVISVVPFDLNPAQVDAYVEGVLAGLNQTQRTHEVVVLVQGGQASEFEQHFKQAAAPKIQHYRIEQPRNFFTKVHFVGERNFAESASMLLLQRDEIVLAAPSSYQPGILLPENSKRVMTDQLYNPERGAQPLDMPVSDAELRDYLGTFVTASFESVLASGEEIGEDTRLLLQDEDERWYARTMEALTNTQAFVTAMLQQTRLTSIAA